MDSLLKDKVIFITGGADGIGWACALAYAKEGAQVCIADIKEAGNEKNAEWSGLPYLFLPCNVAIEADVKKSISLVIERYNRLDAIHNNAGIAHPSLPLEKTSVNEWTAIMDINIRSIYFTTVYGIDFLRQSKGTILNTSSMVGSIGQNNHAAYCASKGAVDALTKAMALDYARDAVRVNAVAPAAIKTTTLEKWIGEQPDIQDIEHYLDHIHPLGYCPGGDVIADVCVFLLSDKARFITGSIVPVSGGAELGYRV